MESSQRSIQCMSALMHFAIQQKKISRMRLPESTAQERPAVKALFAKTKAADRSNLLETDSRDLLAEYGLDLPAALLAANAAEAKRAAREIGYPLAMKVVAPDIVHKSDAGGIKLNLKDEAAVERAFAEIMAGAAKITAKDRVLGALISPMVPEGRECIIGMIRDPQFGPVIMFGLGGIFVEVLKDVAFRVAPLTAEDIDEMIQEIKGFKLLTGVRGESPKDIRALKNILGKLSAIATDNPEIEEFDLNPVIVHQQGASIVDSRVILG
jgi:acyl-CoA synthetase (NDP forming)